MIYPSITGMQDRMRPQIIVTSDTDRSHLGHIQQLRFEILRKPLGLPYESASFPEDSQNSTVHLLAKVNATLVGCATLLLPEPQEPIQLRGMAVASEFQGTGVGKAILLASHEFAKANQRSLWCKARQAAIGFYSRLGWVPFGEPFEIPTIGPHINMEWHPQ